ncbi:hypothetical protein ORI20_14105 [Mycobacterium sp. CVI_P3]|uniref:LtfC/p132/Gp6 beta-sandwich domain-containing protein n=1 Tax=Mycobacterium pinniadriaticum TaxID=2994102 RepID=A0ABT3SEA3_9MYCO|nr:hypothetical protein [Mycobacterium pinniadriaticum]MCX2931414.1 hypothetical protein [Mycobacterium pinniadriaticum]MCX2937838.1 hypothetical protein [Mycobacterium pinniadriaticum]
MPGKFAPLILSRGEQYDPAPLTPRSYGYSQWPTPSIVETTFYASDGGVIATIEGDVAADAIRFDVDPEEVDIVPAGAQYETFLEDNQGKKRQLRYGQVIRKQANFFNDPLRVTGNRVLQFKDNFSNRVGLVGSKWFVLYGKPVIHDNSGASNPNGVGPNHSLFYKAAMRFYAPLNSDTVTLSFNLLNPGPGTLGIAVSSDATMSSYRSISFVSDTVVPANNKVYAASGKGIFTRTNQVPSVAHTIVDNTNYKLRYDDDTKRLALLESDMVTEIIGWTDEDGIVAVGPGHRYFDITWEASATSTGPQVTTISAQDGV